MFARRTLLSVSVGRLLTAICVLPVLSLPVGAQETATAGLEEIVVTAQKREESLQDTPISIAALDSGMLERRKIASLPDMMAVIPNLQISPHPNTGTTVRAMIRGIGEASAVQTRDNPVAVYVDGVYVGRGQGLGSELAELERVEVLRGPQGTLYGRNATAGAINFITKAPILGEFGGQQSFTFGRFDEFRSRSSLNIPLGETAALNLTYARVLKDGFIDNHGPGSKRFGDVDRKGFRGALLWEPLAEFQLRYTFDATWLGDTSLYVAQVPYYPGSAKRPSHGNAGWKALRPADSRIRGHNLTMSYEVSDNLTIRSITGYRDLIDKTNQAYNPGPVIPFLLPLYNEAWTDQKQFSEELQFIGNTLEDRLKYVGGIYYFDESGDGGNNTFITGFQGPRNFDWKNKAYAVFGEGTWTPAILDDRLHITLGARRSWDKRDASVLGFSVIGNQPPALVLQGNGSRSFSDTSLSGSVQFDITDSVNVFARIAEGYKTGGFNPTASTSAAFAAGFGPESLISYEAGLRSEFLDRRVRFNATVFYSDYDDIQTNVFNPNNTRIFDVINAGKAKIKGVEADLSVLVVTGLVVSASYGHIDPEFKEVVDLGGNDITSMFRFPHAPKTSYSINADYTSPETPIGTVQVNVNYLWQDKFFGVTSQPNLIVDSYGLVNARVALLDTAGIEGLEFAIWGKNLADKEYLATHWGFGPVPVGLFGDPRSYGLDASYRF